MPAAPAPDMLTPAADTLQEVRAGSGAARYAIKHDIITDCAVGLCCYYRYIIDVIHWHNSISIPCYFAPLLSLACRVSLR